jgi:hypothetical protein
VTGPGKAQYAAWLRAEREHRGWTRPQMARRPIEAAHIQRDRSVPGLDSMTHNLFRWERGADRSSERYRLLIRAVLDLPPPPPALAPATDQSTPVAMLVPASSTGPPTALTITIQLPPGATAGITAPPAG